MKLQIKYSSPECSWTSLESASILCASDTAGGFIDPWDIDDPHNENPITF